MRCSGLYRAAILMLCCACQPSAGAKDPGEDRAGVEAPAPEKETVSREPLARDEAVNILTMKGVENAYPRWSADGSEILFQSNRTGKWQIYAIGRDGTGERRITNDTFNNNFPDWSPDNSRVAFVSDRDGDEDIYVMNMDGTGLRNISDHPGRDIHPYWSPDGSAILFNSARDDENSFEVYQVRADGSRLRRLTSTKDVETCARFSPGGDRILYLRGSAENGDDEVYAMGPDGTGMTNISRSRAAEGWPVWTPDGSQVVFSSNRSGAFSLYAINADGNGLRRLTYPDPPFYDARAHVSNDGSEIVFNRQSGRTIGIYVIKLERPAALNGR